MSTFLFTSESVNEGHPGTSWQTTPENPLLGSRLRYRFPIVYTAGLDTPAYVSEMKCRCRCFCFFSWDTKRSTFHASIYISTDEKFMWRFLVDRSDSCFLLSSNVKQFLFSSLLPCDCVFFPISASRLCRNSKCTPWKTWDGLIYELYCYDLCSHCNDELLQTSTRQLPQNYHQ